MSVFKRIGFVGQIVAVAAVFAGLLALLGTIGQIAGLVVFGAAVALAVACIVDDWLYWRAWKRRTK